jgi:hypothetical protein
MLQGTVTLVAAIGTVAFVLAVGMYRWHEESGLFATLSMAAWAGLALQAGSITVVTETGATMTRAQPTLQYLSLGLALVSLLAVAGSVTGKWPQDTYE